VVRAPARAAKSRKKPDSPFDRARDDVSPSETAEWYRILYENTPFMYFTLGADGTVLSLNSYGAAHLGYAKDELLGEPVEVVVHPDDRPTVRKHLAECAKSPGPVERWEFRKVRKDGSVLWVKESVRAVRNETGETVVLVICEDVTGQKEAERQLVEHEHKLRGLASKLAYAEERERRQLAIEVHDRIGQALAMSKVEIGNIRKQSGGSESVERARRLIDDAILATRSLTFELSSPLLYELGLEPALQGLGERIAEENGIRFRFRSEGQRGPLSDDFKGQLYRMARELLQNVVRHARATTVELTLRESDEATEIVVKDDGVGFDASGAASAIEANGSFGLFSIRERLDYLDGRLVIDSSPGAGTSIIIRVPPANTADRT
jgi:PAS domain S-box-containing protein